MRGFAKRRWIRLRRLADCRSSDAFMYFALTIRGAGGQAATRDSREGELQGTCRDRARLSDPVFKDDCRADVIFGAARKKDVPCRATLNRSKSFCWIRWRQPSKCSGDRLAAPRQRRVLPVGRGALSVRAAGGLAAGKRLPDETIRQTLVELGQAPAEPMVRIPRRADMSA